MYMIPFVWNTQGRQANEDNKYISSCLGEPGWGVTDGYVDSFSAAENVLKICSVIIVMQLCGYNKPLNCALYGVEFCDVWIIPLFR